MGANTAPIFTGVPNVGMVVVGGTANTASDGSGSIGTSMILAFTAGANGSFVRRIRLTPYASVASTVISNTVFRVYLSTKTSGSTTSADTHLLMEIGASNSVTADQSTVSVSSIELSLDMAIPTGTTLLVSSHVVNAANTGWQCIVSGGDY